MTFSIDTSGVPLDMLARVHAAIDDACRTTDESWDDSVKRVATDTLERAKAEGRSASEAIALARFVESAAEILAADVAMAMLGSMLRDVLGCQIRVEHKTVEVDSGEQALINRLATESKIKVIDAYATYGLERVVRMVAKDLIISDADGRSLILTPLGRYVSDFV
jgi:hypothetical protein